MWPGRRHIKLTRYFSIIFSLKYFFYICTYNYKVLGDRHNTFIFLFSSKYIIIGFIFHRLQFVVDLNINTFLGFFYSNIYFNYI